MCEAWSVERRYRRRIGSRSSARRRRGVGVEGATSQDADLRSGWAAETAPTPLGGGDRIDAGEGMHFWAFGQYGAQSELIDH
jgi:hypothetical protein